MSESNLIPINTRSKEEARELSRKGGLVKSQKKTNAAKINAVLRKAKSGGKPLSEEDRYFLFDMVMSPSTAHTDALLLIKKVQATDLKYGAKLELEWLKLVHGYKGPDTLVQVNNNLSVNYGDACIEAWRRRKAKLLEVNEDAMQKEVSSKGN